MPYREHGVMTRGLRTKLQETDEMFNAYLEKDNLTKKIDKSMKSKKNTRKLVTLKSIEKSVSRRKVCFMVSEKGGKLGNCR